MTGRSRVDGLRATLRRLPVAGGGVSRLLERRRTKRFRGSGAFWESHYRGGGTSGPGSYGTLATFKAETLNTFVRQSSVTSVIEFGCGDGNQLTLADYPAYIGLDVAPSAIRRCAARFAGDPTKSFFLYEPSCFVDTARLFRADMAMSLDVIFHLVEDEVFERYMRHLFDAGQRYVVIYSSNTDEQLSHTPEVRHRQFSRWIERNAPDWRLQDVVKSPDPWDPVRQTGSAADFYIFALSGNP